MNLKSLHRQALSHVEALQKELSMYKKQSLDIVPVKRADYGVSRYALDVEINTVDEELNDDAVYDRSIITPRHPPQDNSPMAISVNSSVSRLAARDVDSSPLVDNDFTSSLEMDERAETPSPNPVTPDSDEDAETSDTEEDDSSAVAFGELHSEDFFHQTYENTLPATPEKENVDVDAMKEQFDNFLSIEEHDESSEIGKLGGAGSNDAFDASFQFQTAFPASFAESTSPSAKNAFADSDFSDSFFLDATIDSRKKKQRSPRGVDVSPLGPVPSPQFGQESTIDEEETDSPMDEALALFPNSAFGASLDDKFVTPQKDERKVLSPAKGVNGVARSRSPVRRNQRKEEAPMDEVRADTGEHSPTLVLKILQQRKAKQISPTPNSSGKGSISISEEIRKLDAIANGVTSSREKRRAVRQPVSYAEPSLNSKLRRGDVFFAKQETDDELSRPQEANFGNDNTLKDRQTNKADAAHTELRTTAS